MTRVRNGHPDETRPWWAGAGAALLGVVLASAVAHGSRAAGLAPAAAPDFVLKSSAGDNLRLSEYRGEVVALAFGASWCGDCREGLAALGRLQGTLAPRGLQVLAVSFDADAAAARAGFPVMIDMAGDTGRLYDVADLPLVVLVDREGRLRQRFAAGRAVPETELRARIEALLDE